MLAKHNKYGTYKQVKAGVVCHFKTSSKMVAVGTLFTIE